ncbi:MAG: efflux RND transporter periplasmic adaptor subunit [Myxococcota bacterium]
MDRMVSPRTPYRGRRSPRARMYRRPLFLVTALALAGILIPLSRSEQVPPAPGSDPAASEPGVSSGPPPVTVEVDRVEPELLRDVATFSGQLDAEYSVLLKPETDGVIEAITFAEGQVVRKDDVLYRLRGGEQRARLREAQATLALKREEYGRTQKLLERNAVSLAQEDRAEAELEVAKARVELAQLELDRTEIRAPFDGVVGQRLVSPGDRVTEDDELVRIDAVDRLQLRFATSEHGVAFARLGAKVELSVVAYPGERFPGEVFFVSPALDPATRRMILKAWVPNPSGRLRPGMFANVDLEIARRDNVILVPESAVVFDRHGTYVWRLDEDGVAERVPIETGLRKGGRVEVTIGLRPGDRVVTAGTHKVTEGKKVVARSSRSTSQALHELSPRQSSGEGT